MIVSQTFVFDGSEEKLMAALHRLSLERGRDLGYRIAPIRVTRSSVPTPDQSHWLGQDSDA